MAAPAVSKNSLAVDISSWQPSGINWSQYEQWSRESGDGVSRVILRVDQGTGTPDSHYEEYVTNAQAAGVMVIGHYHRAYPNLNDPISEAVAFLKYLNGHLRDNDFFFIDWGEDNFPEFTTDWLLSCLAELEKQTGRLPWVYASFNFVETRMQDTRLAKYPLILADWTFNPDSRPDVPAPFVQMMYLQFSDKGSVPGIAGEVDMDVFVGHEPAPGSPPPPPPPPPPVVDPRDAQIAALQKQVTDLTNQLAAANATLATEPPPALLQALASAVGSVDAQLSPFVALNSAVQALKNKLPT